jgi:hypothetical protein
MNGMALIMMWPLCCVVDGFVTQPNAFTGIAARGIQVPIIML